MKFFSWGMVAAISIGVTSQPFACFPRMKSTPSIKPYMRTMPTQPRGTVPFAQGVDSPTGIATFASGPTSLPLATPENVQTGAVYYSYYCEMCHGVGGAGNGTVGHSYIPPAPALDTPKLQAMAEADLSKAMLTGVGHDPVLEHTVPPERRGYVILYLRSLKPQPAGQAALGKTASRTCRNE